MPDCPYFSAINRNGGSTDCHYRDNYESARACWGCGRRRPTGSTDPQVAVEQARQAFLDLHEAVQNVRTVSGRSQAARATLSASREVIALIDSTVTPLVLSHL